MTSSKLAAALLAFTAAAGIGSCDKDRPAPPPPQESKRLAIDPVTEIAKARELIAEGDVNAALARMWPVVQEHPTHLDARVVLAGAYQLAGRYEEALAETKAALDLDDRAVGALLTRSTALASLGRYEEALKTTERLLAIHPEHGAALLNLATFNAKLKRYAAQADALARLVKLNPNRVAMRVELGKTLLRAGNLPKAEAALRDAVKYVPRDVDAQLLLATALYDQGKLTEAMDRADIAARLDPERAHAFELFRASFYVAVARELVCKVGPEPWTREAIEKVLQQYRSQGLRGVEDFYEIHKSYGARPEVKARIAKAAAACKTTTP